uniref:Uncharacterized protein n=1 Tax=Leersia perrieri TaxID=77586 RepID=A0A0D9W8H4_9ORYZ
MPGVARGPLLLSLGLGEAGGALWWIRRAGFRASLADVGGHGDVHYDSEGIAVGMDKATSEGSFGWGSKVEWRTARRRCHVIPVQGGNGDDTVRRVLLAFWRV